MSVRHHIRPVTETPEADRRSRSACRWARPDAGELDRLLRAASQGDAAAWSALLGRFTPRLRSVASSYSLSAHEAEDVVQTTWLRLLEYCDRIREPAAVGAWLETIARRESIRLRQTAARESPAEAEGFAESVAAVAETDLVAGETRTALVGALDRLPSRQQRLLAMLFADDAPGYDRIAGALAMPIGSIGPTRARGLARLREDGVLMAAVGDMRD